jgi:SAM-dependent methyltransferase
MGLAADMGPAATSDQAAPESAQLHWLGADGQPRQARWRCERGSPAPRRLRRVDDSLPADTAYRWAREGTALLWDGDFQNARHLLQAMARRADRPPRRKATGSATEPTAQAPGQAFHRHRQAQALRARVLGQLLVPLQPDRLIALRRAPDVREACVQAWGPADGEPSVVSLRELLGIVSAFEWRRRGVPCPALGPAPDNLIHPHYGVFSPVRGEYLDLVARAPLPPGGVDLALDIGTGTGVLAAILARRGVPRIVATDLSPRALACAQENLTRLRVMDRVQLLAADLFAAPVAERAQLVVCNPPWLPARPGSPLEGAIYDEDSLMLRGFLAGLGPRLAAGGEGWLILSDLAEHLGLRSRAQLLEWISAAGLVVLGRLDTRPRHPKAQDARDPLHAARAAEVTSLWRLGLHS